MKATKADGERIGKPVDLSVEFLGTTLKNPIVVASGPFGYFPAEARRLYRLGEAGALVLKGTSVSPWPGNPPPRLVETPAGLLNSIGLENKGVEWLKRDCLPELRAEGLRVIVNVVGTTSREYREVAEALGDQDILALELNVSCPNVEMDVEFGEDPVALRGLLEEVRRGSRHPLIVKLTPNVGFRRIADLAKAAEDGGAAAISLINTLKGLAVDVEKRRPILGAVFGGLSGPAIKPVALAMVWRAAGAVAIPVIGMGGVTSGRDALEFLMAGARAVGVGTAPLSNPSAIPDMVREMREILDRLGAKRVEEVIGVARGES